MPHSQHYTPCGQLMIGIQGHTLTPLEIQWLQHPHVAGVILFQRNYDSVTKIAALCKTIRTHNADLLIGIDQEGGRVQRLKYPFTIFPAVRHLGHYASQHGLFSASRLGFSIGYLIAIELQAVGIDFAFAPVTDIDYQNNSVIGDRAFADNALVVSQLTQAFYQGQKAAGSIGVAKHFPGHGFVTQDSHHATPVDNRPLEIIMNDLTPFANLIQANIEGIMPAHIIYTATDSKHTALYSPFWQHYLRQTLNFKGLIISDDMDMQGAQNLSATEKASLAFANGVQVLLCCNEQKTIIDILNYTYDLPVNHAIVTQLKQWRNTKSVPLDWQTLPSWQHHHQRLHTANYLYD